MPDLWFATPWFGLSGLHAIYRHKQNKPMGDIVKGEQEERVLEN
jgi:hypothetical protein